MYTPRKIFVLPRNKTILSCVLKKKGEANLIIYI